MIKLKNILTEAEPVKEVKSFEEFATTRGEGAAKIAATAEREASQLKGQGIALFREEVAKGMSEAALKMREANLDTSLILFSMWTESVKEFAEKGKGNVIFLDGSTDGMQSTMNKIMAMDQLKTLEKSKKA